MPTEQKSYIDFQWQAFLNGDEKAFSAIYNRFAVNLYAYGKKFSVDEQLLDDAVQEVFVDFYMKRQSIVQEVKNPKAYLFVALKNNLLKKISLKKRITNIGFDNFRHLNFEVEYDAQEKLISSEIEEESRGKLQEAINQLSKKQKEIIYLKFEEELDYPEVAEVLQISIDSARKQLYRAIKSLRLSLDFEEINALIHLFIKKS